MEKQKGNREAKRKWRIKKGNGEANGNGETG